MNDKTHKPSSIVIVGGGTAGWMAASLLQHHWADCRISLIESQDIATIGVGEGSTPYMRHFFKQLAIPNKHDIPIAERLQCSGVDRDRHCDFLHRDFADNKETWSPLAAARRPNRSNASSTVPPKAFTYVNDTDSPGAR